MRPVWKLEGALSSPPTPDIATAARHELPIPIREPL
jgi:hypothetical protein